MRSLILLPLAVVLAAACTSDDKIVSNDVVESIPWEAPETAEYRVLDDDGDEVGALTLSIEEADDGMLLFRQHFDFPENEFVNEATVTTDPDELQPAGASFLIEGPEGDLNCEATYSPGHVAVHRVGEDGERSDEKAVPDIAYDSWGDLFLWRTINFDEGSELEYADVLSCTLGHTQTLGVTLKVKGIEEVEAPAGTFEAWRIEIDSGGETQKAWYGTDERRALIKYDNGRETFELTSLD